jgi:hypothetical protein
VKLLDEVRFSRISGDILETAQGSVENPEPSRCYRGGETGFVPATPWSRTLQPEEDGK